MQSNQITIKDLYTFDSVEKLYTLFKQLVTFRLDTKPRERLQILDMFFLTYKYPKLKEFADNIRSHSGEDGIYYAQVFLRDSYELFLKENDPELYSIYQAAEEIWCHQSGIDLILKDGIDPTEPKKCTGDTLPF